MPGFSMMDKSLGYRDLPWLQRYGQQMATALEQGTLAHAWLLQGTQGIGKHLLAEHLSQLMLCAAPQHDQPCGQCRSCQLIAAGTHPDKVLLEPEEAGKPIKIDAVRDLVTQLQLTPQVAKRKIVLVDPAEAMNVNAANALLKTLEEPPGAAILLLISHAPGRLLATIRSRCQKLQIAAPAQASTVTWLQQQTGKGADEIRATLLQNTAPLTAYAAITEEAKNAPSADALVNDLQRLYQGSVPVIEVAARWSGQEARQSLALWQRVLEQDLRARSSNTTSSFPQLSATDLFRMHDVVRDAQGWLAVPLQQVLLWEDLFTRWHRLQAKSMSRHAA
jgi:DNA polymerase-3 subunit delta'